MSSVPPELFLLETWVSENPGSRLFLKLAEAHMQAGRLSQAAQVLNRGLVMRPEEIAARRMLAQIMAQKGDANGALEQLNLAAAELARQSGLFEEMAGILDQIGEASQAGTARELGQILAAWPTGSEQGEVVELSTPQQPLAGEQGPEPGDTRRAGGGESPPSPEQVVLDRLEAMRQAALSRARERA